MDTFLDNDFSIFLNYLGNSGWSTIIINFFIYRKARETYCDPLTLNFVPKW